MPSTRISRAWRRKSNGLPNCRSTARVSPSRERKKVNDAGRPVANVALVMITVGTVPNRCSRRSRTDVDRRRGQRHARAPRAAAPTRPPSRRHSQGSGCSTASSPSRSAINRPRVASKSFRSDSSASVAPKPFDRLGQRPQLVSQRIGELVRFQHATVGIRDALPATGATCSKNSSLQ